jgi:hypothetical protein
VIAKIMIIKMLRLLRAWYEEDMKGT